MDTNDHAPTILLTPCQTSPTEPNGKNWVIFRSVLILTFFLLQSPLSKKTSNRAPLSFGTASPIWISSRMARRTFESSRPICFVWSPVTAWSWPVLPLIARNSRATSWRWLRVIGASQRGMECTNYRHDSWVMNDATSLEPIYYSNWTGDRWIWHDIDPSISEYITGI